MVFFFGECTNLEIDPLFTKLPLSSTARSAVGLSRPAWLGLTQPVLPPLSLELSFLTLPCAQLRSVGGKEQFRKLAQNLA